MTSTAMFLKIAGNMKPLKGLMKPTDTLPKMIPASGFLRDIPDHI
jgi:hypothetical protein